MQLRGINAKTEHEAPFFNTLSIPDGTRFALFPLPCQQAFVPPVTATMLCIGRAPPSSICGDKYKTEHEAPFFNAVSIPDGTRFTLFPLPCQQAFVPPATATTLCIGRATSHFLGSSQEKKGAALCDRDHVHVFSWIKKSLTAPRKSSSDLSPPGWQAAPLQGIARPAGHCSRVR